MRALSWLFLPVRIFGAYKFALFIAAGGLGLTVAGVIAHIREATWIDAAAYAVALTALFTILIFLILAYFQEQSGLCSPILLRWYKVPLRRVSWNFDNYLTGPVGRVSRFGPSFTINWGEGITIEAAYIECKRTDMKLDVLVERGNPYLKADNVFYPKGKTYQCQALFYDPAAQQRGELEGMTTQDFLTKFDGFAFVFRYDGQEFRKTFSRSDLETLFQCYWQKSHNRPEPIPEGARPSFKQEPTIGARADQITRYEPEEIRRMLLAAAGLRDIIEQKCRPSYETLLRVTEQWDLLLRQIGPRQMVERLAPIRNNVRQAEKDIDKIFNENQHYFDVLRPIMFDTPNPPGYGVDSALSMMMDELMELAGTQNIDIVKWIRPRYEESIRMAVQYGDWIGKASHRINEKTRGLREWPTT